MSIQEILGSDFGKDAFKTKVNGNFTEIVNQLADKLPNSHDTDETAHTYIRESINTLDTDKVDKKGDTMEGFLQAYSCGEALDTSITNMPIGSLTILSGALENGVFKPIITGNSNASFIIFGRIGKADQTRSQIVASCYIKSNAMFLNIIEGSETYIKAEGANISIMSNSSYLYGREYEFTLLRIY